MMRVILSWQWTERRTDITMSVTWRCHRAKAGGIASVMIYCNRSIHVIILIIKIIMFPSDGRNKNRMMSLWTVWSIALEPMGNPKYFIKVSGTANTSIWFTYVPFHSVPLWRQTPAKSTMFPDDRFSVGLNGTWLICCGQHVAAMRFCSPTWTQSIRRFNDKLFLRRET